MLQPVSHQLVIGERKTLDHHASTVLPLSNGHVLAAWFGGSREGGRDVEIWMAEKDSRGFSESRCVTCGPEPCWNPVLFETRDHTVNLYYKTGTPITEWRTLLMQSGDMGKTWSEPRELVPGDRTGGRGPVRSKPIYLRSGRIVAPASREEGLWRCFMDLSDDNGVTWRPSNLIEARGTGQLHAGILYWQKRARDAWASGLPFDASQVPPEFAHGRGVIQPTLWEDETGVHALLRSGEGLIYRTDSGDDGETWCEAYPTTLPSNNSGIDLTRLPDGELLLAYNPVAGNFGCRTPLTLALSRDRGESWENLCNLEAGPGEFSYPAIVSRGYRVFVTYTYRRENIAFWEFEWIV